MGPLTYNFEYEIYDFFESEFEPLAEKLLIGVAVFALAVLLIALASWIMRSIALTHLGNRRGIKAPWLVWLPIVGCWTIGALADDYDAKNGLKRRFRVILLVCSILAVAIQSSSYSSVFSEIIEFSFKAEYGVSPEMAEELLEALLLVYAGAIVCSLVYMIQYVITYICIYKVYESTLPRRAVLCFILGLLVPLAEPICLLVAMNKGYPNEAPTQPVLCEAAPEAIGWYET